VPLAAVASIQLAARGAVAGPHELRAARGRLRVRVELLALGLNLAGIAVVLDLETDNAALRAELDDREP